EIIHLKQEVINNNENESNRLILTIIKEIDVKIIDKIDKEYEYFKYIRQDFRIKQFPHSYISDIKPYSYKFYIIYPKYFLRSNINLPQIRNFDKINFDNLSNGYADYEIPLSLLPMNDLKIYFDGYQSIIDRYERNCNYYQHIP